MCTHTHTCAHTQRHMQSSYTHSRHRHTCTQTHGTHTQLTPAGHGHAFTLSNPALRGQRFLPLSLPGQGLQLPWQGQARCFASHRPKAPPAAQPQPSPDHTLCPALSPTVGAPRGTGQVCGGGQRPLNKWSWFPSLSVLVPCGLLSSKQDSLPNSSSVLPRVPPLAKHTPHLRGQG